MKVIFESNTHEQSSLQQSMTYYETYFVYKILKMLNRVKNTFLKNVEIAASRMITVNNNRFYRKRFEINKIKIIFDLIKR